MRKTKKRSRNCQERNLEHVRDFKSSPTLKGPSTSKKATSSSAASSSTVPQITRKYVAVVCAYPCRKEGHDITMQEGEKPDPTYPRCALRKLQLKMFPVSESGFNLYCWECRDRSVRSYLCHSEIYHITVNYLVMRSSTSYIRI